MTDKLVKPQQPPVTTRATATRHYTWDAADGPRVKRDYSNETSAITDLRITVDHNGRPEGIQWSGLAIKKDGTPGRAERSGRFWAIDLPEWVADLVADMPTPKVTLIPPRKAVQP